MLEPTTVARAQPSGGNVTLVNSSNKIVKAFNLGQWTIYGLAYDPIHNYIFVADGGWPCCNMGHVYVLSSS